VGGFFARCWGAEGSAVIAAETGDGFGLLALAATSDETGVGFGSLALAATSD
jgi:hypothetical protein